FARVLYEDMRKEAASIRIQKHARAHRARVYYTSLQASAIVIQSGLRALAARNEYRHNEETFKLFVVTNSRRNELLHFNAARETGALKEAKGKLEKRVEELTWRNIEKHMRAFQDPKDCPSWAHQAHQPSTKQNQLGEAFLGRQQLVHRLYYVLAFAPTACHKAAKIAIEQAPAVIKEVPVVDNTKVELLKNKNDELESEVEEPKNRIKDFEERYIEIEKDNQARLKEAEEAQLKATQLQETIERFLKGTIENLKLENKSLRSPAAAAIEQKVHPGKIETDQEVAVVQQIQPRAIADNVTVQIKDLDNGNQTEEELHARKEPRVPVFFLTKSLFGKNSEWRMSLLLRRECCSFSNGKYLKAGLHELELWCLIATDQIAGSSWGELKHIRQSVGFLVLHHKTQNTLEEITDELCPVLSIPEIYRIGTMFWDDKYGTQGLSPEAIPYLLSHIYLCCIVLSLAEREYL
ncbi:hypothetical protein TSUD_280150, partial [Trifolium subterraneum]